MVSSRTVAILTGILGTIAYCNAFVPSSLGTEIVIAKHKEVGENLIDNAPHTGHGISPFISKFIQKGTNIFFKPHFMLSSAHISPPVQTMIVENEDCVETPVVPAPLIPPPIVMDEPIIPVPVIIEKPLEPVIIPEAPVLPPLTLPVPPLPVVDCEEVIGPHPLPIIPMPMPPVPVVIEEPPAPLVIPEAPVLPPLSLPALPLPVFNDCDEMVALNPPELPLIPVVPPPVIIPEPPVVIPEAPVLPPLTLPNFPVPVMVEEHVECDDKIINEPLVIPTASVLEMPMQPIHFPTLPVIHHSLTPQIAVVREKIERVNRVVMPQLPVIDPIFSFPAECVQNIITERILPNILNQHFEVVPAVPSYPVPSPYLPPLIKMF